MRVLNENDIIDEMASYIVTQLNFVREERTLMAERPDHGFRKDYVRNYQQRVMAMYDLADRLGMKVNDVRRAVYDKVAAQIAEERKSDLLSAAINFVDEMLEV